MWAARLGVVVHLTCCLLLRMTYGQDGDIIEYCSGVAFVSDNTGFLTDGAVDTGMGVYIPDTDCKWVIKPEINDLRERNARRVVLVFDYLNVESGFDFVKVYETNPAGKLLGLFSGSMTPPTVVSTTSILYVQFITDGTGQRLGFKADWHTTGCPNDCGSRGSCVNMYCFCDEGYFGGDCSSSFCVGTKTYTAIVGSMMDHYRQLNEEAELIIGDFTYRNNADCRWLLKPLLLTAPFFTIEFTLMDTEIGRDVFYIYDGGNMNAPLLAKISGSNITMPLLDSAGPELFVRFITDKMKAFAGVYAQWDTLKECGGVYGYCQDGQLDGALAGPRPNNAYCWDAINDPPEHDKKGRCICKAGWFGGDCSYANCLGAKTLTSRIGYLMDHHDGLETVGTNERVPVSFNDYQPSSYCRWYISPNETVNFLVVTITYFDLEQGCDFLKIYDGNSFFNRTILRNTGHNYVYDGVMTGTGIGNGNQFLSTGPNLFLQLRTDVSNAAPHIGFKLTYEGVYCAGTLTLTDASGEFTDGSPEGEMYYPYTNCYWHIKPDEKYFLSAAAVLEFQVEYLSIWKDLVYIHEGDSTDGPLIQRFQDKIQDPVFYTTSTRDVFILFWAGCYEENCDRGLGFKVKWSINQGADFCQQTFPTIMTGIYGNIYPYAPGTATTYRNLDNCTWIIDVPGPVEELWLRIEDLNLAIEYGDSDSVSIYDGHDEYENKLLQKSTEKFDTLAVRAMKTSWVLLKSGKALVRFQSNNQVPGHWFHITYEAVMTAPLVSTVLDEGASGSSVMATAGALQTLYVQAVFTPYCQAGVPVIQKHYEPCRHQPSGVLITPLPSWCPDGPDFARVQQTCTKPFPCAATGGAVTTASGLTTCLRDSGGAKFRLRWIYGLYDRDIPDFSGSVDKVDTTHEVFSVDLGNGQYTLSYLPKYSGQIAAYISVLTSDGWINIGSDGTEGALASTLTINVRPTFIEASKSHAEDILIENELAVGGMSGGKAGLTYEFKIVTKDLFENPVTAGEERWDNAFIVKFDSGLILRWGTLEDNKDGTFKVTFTIDVAGTYLCHIMFRDTNSTYVTLKGTPFETTIRTVTCPLEGDDEPCNGRGTCFDTGVCECEVGWTGDYCQDELAGILRLIIILENSILMCGVLAVCISQFWKRCVVEKEMFERLQYDDIEEDW